MFRSLKLVAIAASLALLAPALASSFQLAGKPTVFATKTTMSVKASTVEGTISSPKAGCLNNRSVTLQYAAVGGRYPAKTVRSDAQGHWSVPFTVEPGAKGQLIASVGAKRLSSQASCEGTTKHKALR